MLTSTASHRRIALLAVVVAATACATPGSDGGGRPQALTSGDAGPAVAAELSPEEVLLAARSVEPEEALTIEQRVAQAAIDEGLSGLISRCGREAPLTCASEAELVALGQAGRMARGTTTRWATDLAAARVAPTPEHRGAITRLAEASIGDFAIEYDQLRGTPGRLDQVGFVRRPLPGDSNSALESWRAMLVAHRSSMDTLFGASLADELELVEQMRMGSLELLRFRRVVAGFPVESDTVDVLVTNETAPLGPGVVWRIRASWSTTASLVLNRLSRTALLDESEAKGLVGLTRDAGNAQLRFRCEPDGCTATWYVDATDGVRFAVDAMTGAIVGPFDPRGQGAGSVTIGTIRPGAAGVQSTSRFRGARFKQGSTEIGNTNRTTGAYSNVTPDPWNMVLTGGTSTTGGPWMDGRVDRRSRLNLGYIMEDPVNWTPTTQPNRNFGSPDAWPPNIINLQHGGEIVYSWLTYWTDLFRVGGSGGSNISQVTGTLSFTLRGVSGLGGGNGAGYSYGAAGSGQTSWGVMTMEWLNTDTNPPNSDVWLGAFGHEFGHTIGNCAASAGVSCDDGNPGTLATRPAIWTDYKRQVYGAHIENLAVFLGAVLGEWRDPVNFAIAFNPFETNFRYGGYFDTTDTFGSVLSDSAGGIDCAQCAVNSAKCCPTSHTCISPTDDSPFVAIPVGAPQGICARICSNGTGCQAFEADLTCTSFNATPGYCWQSDYTNNWFTTVGTRLMFDTQWDRALLVLLAAQAGSSYNATRDFNLGTDSFYATMGDFGVDTLEVTRAVRSATNEVGVTSRDDFTGDLRHALPITVYDTVGTLMQWGNGANIYPRINDSFDYDMVLFRGLANTSYQVTSTAVNSSTLSPTIAVYKWIPSFPLIASGTGPTGGTATVTIPAAAMTTTDWYVVTFGTASGGGQYYSRLRVASASSDDFSLITAEAYPIVTGIPQAGYLNAGDLDKFQIYVPATTSLSITTTGTPAPTIDIRNSSNTLVATGTGTATVPSASVGFYYVDIRDLVGSSRAYTLTPTIGCAATNCDDPLPNAPPTPTRNTWGDRFGGRLPTGASSVSYSVALNANENAVFSLADNSNTSCRLALDVTPPSELLYFVDQFGQGIPVFRWDDLLADNGPAAGNRDGIRLGAGGHLTAPITGTYKLTVHRENPSQVPTAACHYRLFIGRAGHMSTPRPQW